MPGISKSDLAKEQSLANIFPPDEILLDSYEAKGDAVGSGRVSYLRKVTIAGQDYVRKVPGIFKSEDFAKEYDDDLQPVAMRGVAVAPSVESKRKSGSLEPEVNRDLTKKEFALRRALSRFMPENVAESRLVVRRYKPGKYSAKDGKLKYAIATRELKPQPEHQTGRDDMVYQVLMNALIADNYDTHQGNHIDGKWFDIIDPNAIGRSFVESFTEMTFGEGRLVGCIGAVNYEERDSRGIQFGFITGEDIVKSWDKIKLMAKAENIGEVGGLSLQDIEEKQLRKWLDRFFKETVQTLGADAATRIMTKIEEFKLMAEFLSQPENQDLQSLPMHQIATVIYSGKMIDSEVTMDIAFTRAAKALPEPSFQSKRFYDYLLGTKKYNDFFRTEVDDDSFTSNYFNYYQNQAATFLDQELPGKASALLLLKTIANEKYKVWQKKDFSSANGWSIDCGAKNRYWWNPKSNDIFKLNDEDKCEIITDYDQLNRDLEAKLQQLQQQERIEQEKAAALRKREEELAAQAARKREARTVAPQPEPNPASPANASVLNWVDGTEAYRQAQARTRKTVAPANATTHGNTTTAPQATTHQAPLSVAELTQQLRNVTTADGQRKTIDAINRSRKASGNAEIAIELQKPLNNVQIAFVIGMAEKYGGIQNMLDRDLTKELTQINVYLGRLGGRDLMINPSQVELLSAGYVMQADGGRNRDVGLHKIGRNTALEILLSGAKEDDKAKLQRGFEEHFKGSNEAESWRDRVVGGGSGGIVARR